MVPSSQELLPLNFPCHLPCHLPCHDAIVADESCEKTFFLTFSPKLKLCDENIMNKLVESAAKNTQMPIPTNRVKVEPTKFNFGTTCPPPFVIKIISNPIPSKSTFYVKLYTIQLRPVRSTQLRLNSINSKLILLTHFYLFKFVVPSLFTQHFDKTLKLSKMKSKITFNTLE